MTDNEFLRELTRIACKNIDDVDCVIVDFGHLLEMLAQGEMDMEGRCQLVEMFKNENNAFKNSELLMFLGKNIEKTSDAMFYNTGYILEVIYCNLRINADPRSIEQTILSEYGESSKYYISFFMENNNPSNYNRMSEMDDDNYINTKPFGLPNSPDIPTTNTTFDDVAGIDSVKAELVEVVDFLKNPEKYNKLGAKIPKGVLLTGLPGVGKTLLAKAVAGEAECAFIPMAGSEFIEQYVGVGAKRVRELFEKARSYGTCIVFIDEIDALAGARGSDSNSERDATVNQLLTEMDGFSSGDDNILIIGATNHKSLLDTAVLRPGRFDRVVHVDLPDINGREEILKVHAKNKPLDEAVDLRKIAEKTVGMSGADLANLLNESAILGARRSADAISMLDIERASEKVIMGLPKEKAVTEEERISTAIHEVGHSIAICLLPTDSKLHSLTIIPRGDALGYARKVKSVEKGYKTKSEYINDIMVSLAGVCAEEVFLKEVTSGCSSDLKRANTIAKHMICDFGMNGSFVISDKPNPKQIEKLLKKCYDDTKALLENNKEIFIRITKALLEKETLYGTEVEKILGVKKEEKNSYSERINEFKKLL